MIIYTYLRSQFLLGILLVGAAVICTVIIIQSFKLLSTFNGTEFFSIFTFIKLLSYIMPSIIFTILPVILFVSSIYTFNKLFQDNELNAIRALGISNVQIITSFLPILAIFVSLSYFISLYLMPKTYNSFIELSSDIRTKYITTMIQEKTFSKLKGDITVYVNKKDKYGVLHDVIINNLLYDNEITITASTATINKFGDIKLCDGYYQEKNINNEEISTLRFQEYYLDSNTFNKSSGNKKYIDGMTVQELFLEGHDKNNTAKGNKAFLYGHNRLTWPIYCMTLSLLSISIILLFQTSRKKSHKQYIYSGAISVLFIIFYLTNNYLVIKNVKYSLLIYFNILMQILSVIIIMVKLNKNSKNHHISGL